MPQARGSEDVVSAFEAGAFEGDRHGAPRIRVASKGPVDGLAVDDRGVDLSSNVGQDTALPIASSTSSSGVGGVVEGDLGGHHDGDVGVEQCGLASTRAAREDRAGLVEQDLVPTVEPAPVDDLHPCDSPAVNRLRR